jgi:hypothetical protein
MFYISVTLPVLTPAGSVAHQVVAERFRPDSKDERDMLGSFIRHGVSQSEAEAESLVQM